MEDPLPPDPYKALGIAKDASLVTVKGAHRKLALTCHPDKVVGETAKKAAADKFHLVQQAYEILSDETRRQRYDERVKLAELQADVMSQKSGRVIPERAPRTKTTTSEMRGDRIVEERVPRRVFEEDYFQSHYTESRYPGARLKTYDDRPFVQISKKSSARASERRTKEMARESEEERDRRRKEAEKAARSERNKRRERDKRRDSDHKSTYRNAYVEEETDSDSDVTERIHRRRQEMPRRPYEDMRRPELPRRSTKREEHDAYDDYDTKHTRAQDYIAQSRSSVNADARRSPLPSRSYSHMDARPPLTPKTAPMPVIEPNGRRGSGRGSSRREPSPPPRLSKKDRRPTEIVESLPNSRRPKLPEFMSDPKGLNIPLLSSRKEPQRAQTLETVPERKHPSVRRTQTMPPHLSPTETTQPKSTRYKIYDDSTDSEDEVIVVPDQDGGYTRVREVSPKSRRPPMAPHSASKLQMSPMRASSHAIPPDQPPTPRTAPPFVRTESGRPSALRSRPSARGSAPLYGEVPPSEDLPYRIVNQSPRIKRDDISYSPRRASDDLDRDVFPGSHHRPTFPRSESRAVYT